MWKGTTFAVCKVTIPMIKLMIINFISRLARLVRSCILALCQPHRVTSGRSHTAINQNAFLKKISYGKKKKRKYIPNSEYKLKPNKRNMVNPTTGQKGYTIPNQEIAVKTGNTRDRAHRLISHHPVTRHWGGGGTVVQI